LDKGIDDELAVLISLARNILLGVVEVLED
jgi:hypothetical protein